MSIFFKPRKAWLRQDERRRKRRMELAKSNPHALTYSRTAQSYVFEVLLFAFMAVALILICFVGRSKTAPFISDKRPSPIQVIAREDFSYVSQRQTQRLISQRELLVPTTITLDLSGQENFKNRVQAFEAALGQFGAQIGTLEPGAHRRDVAEKFSASVLSAEKLSVGAEDALTLAALPASECRRLFARSLDILLSLAKDGVYDNSQESDNNSPLFSAENWKDKNARPLDEATQVLQRQLSSLSKNDALTQALTRLFSQGLAPNLAPDVEATQKRKAEAVATIDPVSVNVSKGEVIIHEGKTPTQDDIEKLNAYQKFLSKHGLADIFGDSLLRQSVLTVILLVCASIYLRVGMPSISAPRNKVLLMCVVVLLTLGLSRLLIELDASTFFKNYPYLRGSFSLLMPPVLSALLVSILIGTRPAVLACLMSSLFGSLMLGGNSIDIFAGSFLAALLTVRLTQGIHQRARIVRAGFFAGLAIAAFTLALEFIFYHEALDVILLRMFLAVFVCVLAAVLAIGLFPVFEAIFKLTTDIRLLELTDFNHPLLRRLQIDAPGTYHHSLMVATLAERAAADIGANPIAARVGALFHDIGKIDRPEYFTENQRTGLNPHNGDLSPPMSALIIKSHVKEGEQIARQARLPAAVLDAIVQHHGTGIIRYFFDKAKRLHDEHDKRNAYLDQVDEATYRYDGPRPQSKETAIIHLADSVEAASRSLKKITPQSVEELTDHILRDKLLDGQLDESPLTVKELATVKESFALTLMTMLHGRVSYAAAQPVAFAHKKV